MTRARDLSNDQANGGVATPPFVAGKNFIINGGMDFFQRASLSTTSGGYGLDRWFTVASGSASASTVTQQTTGVPVGSRYCGRVTTGASSGYGNQYQFIETANCAALWGKTVTVSVKLRRSSAFAGSLTVALNKTSTVDGGNAATFTPIASTTATNAQLPTGTTSLDWYTVAFNAVIPNDGTANTLQFAITQSQVETSAYWEMAQAQLEVGLVVTPFSRSGGTIANERAACNWYFEAQNGNTVDGSIGIGFNVTTTEVLGTIYYSPKRVSPNITLNSGNIEVVTANNAITALSNISFGTYGQVSTTSASIYGTGSGFTAGQGNLFRSGTTPHTIWISSEL